MLVTKVGTSERTLLMTISGSRSLTEDFRWGVISNLPHIGLVGMNGNFQRCQKPVQI